jgi:hypothetical protein
MAKCLKINVLPNRIVINRKFKLKNFVLRNRAYYSIKPLLPRGIRIAVRGWLARRTRERTHDTWPIIPGSEHPPKGWSGWPEEKKFALVLTHDIESPGGLSKAQKLMRIEKQLGFRSSFNFIPEGSYSVPITLREEMTSNGFEVGVHDLKHDGHLYRSQKSFRQSASRINHYLREWHAVGFRSAFMLNKLEWLHDLDVLYDASTFDTDPFEPQPQGCRTIFPFVVKGGNGSSYVELPYTLPQDSTVFLLLKEKGIQLWKDKLKWIAEHGGMALLNVHPDYMTFEEKESSKNTFPFTLYREFLDFVSKEYQNQYWNPLPREVAQLVNRNEVKMHRAASKVPVHSAASEVKHSAIWIDLDNTPHVPFFEPIIEELSRRGHQCVLTARDAFQVCEMADQRGMSYTKIGRHHGKNAVVKLAGLYLRAMQLRPAVQRHKPVLAISHGSRAQSILANFLRIPNVIIADYEHARFLPLMGPDWEIVPDVIPDSSLYCKPDKILKYPGIKEDVYVPQFKPDRFIREQLQLADHHIVVTARPPASEAHYRNPESDILFSAFMDRALLTPDVKIVLLPRNSKQAEVLRAKWAHDFQNGRIVIPEHAVDGLNLLWYSDLAVSGGGTMNREAAALGVPVYSVFRGTIGAVDRHLAAEGRLMLIETRNDVVGKLKLERRPKYARFTGVRSSAALFSIVNHIEYILASCGHKAGYEPCIRPEEVKH